jgi:hypothetical protein
MTSALTTGGSTTTTRPCRLRRTPRLVVAWTVAGRGWLLALRRLAYLGVTTVLGMLRLLPMSDRAKDVEILVLRHQITVLGRQRHGQRIRCTAADRALLAALLHRLPRTVLHQIRLLVLPPPAIKHLADSSPRPDGYS